MRLRKEKEVIEKKTAETRSEFLMRLAMTARLARRPYAYYSIGYSEPNPDGTAVGLTVLDLEKLLELANAGQSFASAVAAFTETTNR